jgi:uncharacterized membrane protein
MRWVLCILFLAAICEARNFTGTATLTIEQPTDTRMAICTPNEKYTMEPDGILKTKLYARNDMDDKTVRRIYVKTAPTSFNVTFSPLYLENIEPGEYKYFNVTVNSKGISKGDYDIMFVLATDEYVWGAFEEPIKVKVRSYSNELTYFFATTLFVILAATIYRWFSIRKINRHHRKRH